MCPDLGFYIPMPTKRNKSLLEECLIPGLGQRRYKKENWKTFMFPKVKKNVPRRIIETSQNRVGLTGFPLAKAKDNLSTNINEHLNEL